MQPRFSILALLGITGWVALSTAALLQPLSIWVFISSGAWTAVLAAVAIVAAQRHSESTVFARGTLFIAFTYVFATWSDALWYSAGFISPHDKLAEMIYPWVWEAVPPTPITSTTVLNDEHYRVTFNLERVLYTNLSLLCGLFGGAFALWWHRALERRESK